MPDHYDILGVGEGATSAQIRAAYARIAKERHPDRFSDPIEKERAQEFFKEATAAFNALSNERARREYDAERAKPKLSTPEEIARDALARGLATYEAGDYHAAVELLRTTVGLMPEDARAHAALARALARNPNWVREAIQEVENATRLDPRNAAYHAELAELLHGQGLKIRARKALETALRLAPEHAAVRRVADIVAPAVDEGPEPGGGGLRGLLRKKP